MIEQVLRYSRAVFPKFHLGKLLLLTGLIALVSLPGPVGEVARESVSEAYIAVTVFVALTLLLIEASSRYLNFDVARFTEENPKLQVLTSTALGALPGCGGAIFVLTQFVRGKVSFGSIVGALTATMGDAAFLLIAAKPQSALVVISCSIVVGVISGTIIDRIHGRDFLAVKKLPQLSPANDTNAADTNAVETGAPRKDLQTLIAKMLWIILPVGGVLGIGNAFQIDPDTVIPGIALSPYVTAFGIGGAILCVGFWCLDTDSRAHVEVRHVQAHCSTSQKILDDTTFVTVWVILAFLSFELTVAVTGHDLQIAFQTVWYLLPLIAILIGFLPGCGPQILVTSMYISNVIPFSAEIGNAISNDGDALFPAIAMAPKAAVVATLYSAIPAFIVSYGYLLLFE